MKKISFATDLILASIFLVMLTSTFTVLVSLSPRTLDQTGVLGSESGLLKFALVDNNASRVQSFVLEESEQHLDLRISVVNSVSNSSVYDIVSVTNDSDADKSLKIEASAVSALAQKYQILLEGNTLEVLDGETNEYEVTIPANTTHNIRVRFSAPSSEINYEMLLRVQSI